MKNKIQKQLQWWKYAAGTIPFIALAIIVLLDFVGWTELHNKLLFTILIIFFSTGVLWWWWAVDKIVYLTKLLIDSERKFLEIKYEINSIKKDVESLDERSKNT
jgi:hypothetical protein